MADRKSSYHGMKDAEHNEHEHGLGAQPSPPDERDYPFADLLAAAGVQAGAALPSWYLIPDRPPITDQDGTPMCIAYSSASDQNAEDHADFGSFFNFNEAQFFQQIGGGPNGSYMRVAMEQRLKHGYPVTTIGKPGKHKIAAYYRIPIDVQSIKLAVKEFGGVLLVGPWFHSWFHPNKSGRLPPPDYASDFHAFLVVGWNDAVGSFKCNNSWGTDWGKQGKFNLPFGYIGQMLEAWKTRDA